MSKRYRLLKDLPDCKVGTAFTDDGHGSYDYKDRLGMDSWYSSHNVENNPEWFEPIPDTPAPEQTNYKNNLTGDTIVTHIIPKNESGIKSVFVDGKKFVPEQTTKEEFVWTDELVKEFAQFHIDDFVIKTKWPEDSDTLLKKFKASKQSQSNTKKERWGFCGNCTDKNVCSFIGRCKNANPQSKSNTPKEEQPIKEDRIEEILKITNTDSIDTVIDWLKRYFTAELYTKEQLGKAIEHAFNAARKQYVYGISNTSFLKYPTLQDYLSTI